MLQSNEPNSLLCFLCGSGSCRPKSGRTCVAGCEQAGRGHPFPGIFDGKGTMMSPVDTRRRVVKTLALQRRQSHEADSRVPCMGNRRFCLTQDEFGVILENRGWRLSFPPPFFICVPDLTVSLARLFFLARVYRYNETLPHRVADSHGICLNLSFSARQRRRPARNAT